MRFELNIVEKYDVLKEAFSKRVETNEGWKDEYRKLYKAADANAR